MIKRYALRHIQSKQLIGFTTVSDLDGNIAYSLKQSEGLFYGSGEIWMTDNKNLAEKAAVTDTAWYNADYDSPQNNMAGQLEVVELTIEVKMQ